MEASIMDYGVIIHKLMKRCEITQGQLAERLGVTQSTISRWANGKSTPYSNERLRIIDAATKAAIHLDGIEKAPPFLPINYDVKSESQLAAIAERLRLMRMAYGRTQGVGDISQSAFCAVVGISPQLWNNAEVGHTGLGLQSAIKMAKRIGITLDWIYLGRREGLPVNMATEISKLEIEERGLPRDWLDL
jgi:transcriptional regulator with XRE-family HTH domain